MKPTRILGLFVFLSSLVIFFSTGCLKSKTEKTCATCKPVRAEFSKEVKINNAPFSVGVFKSSGYSNLVYAKVQNESEATAGLMKSIMQDLSSNRSYQGLLSNNYIPVNYNIFISKNIRTETDVVLADIHSVSLIMYKEFGLHHYYFKKGSNGIFEIDPQYSTTTNGLNYKDKFLMFTKEVATGSPTITYSLISMVTPDFNDVKDRIRTRNELRSRLTDLSTTMGKFYPGDEECDEEVCTPIEDDIASECRELIGGQGCVETEDDQCAFRSVSNSYDKWNEYLDMKDTFYLMRDNILANSTNGEEIIDNYYIAGQYIWDNINSIDLGQMYGLIEIIYAKTVFLLNTPLSETVLINTSLKNDLLSMIGDLRSLDNAQEWQDVLDWAELLIDQFYDESANAIWTYINS